MAMKWDQIKKFKINNNRSVHGPLKYWKMTQAFMVLFNTLIYSFLIHVLSNYSSEY